MRKRWLVVLLVLLGLVATGGTTASADDDDDDDGPALVSKASGNYEFSGPAAGSFFAIGPFTWRVRLYSDGSVRGSYDYRQVRDGVELTASGPLTCAVFIGNRVWVGGLITASSRASLVGLDMWFQAQDNGKRGRPSPDVSSTLGAGPAGTGLQYCVDHPTIRFPFDVSRGDLKVKSAVHDDDDD